MTARAVSYGAWALCAACLYFFENNAGTRAVLLLTALLPLLPPVRKAHFSASSGERDAQVFRLSQARSPALQEDDGDIRPYAPGDPLNRIHWKLSARRDELLVRPAFARPQDSEAQAPREELGKTDAPREFAVRVPAALLAAAALFFLLAALLPEARRGCLELLNHLRAASESVNAYSYERFAVPDGQGFALAAVLLSACGACLCAAAAWAGGAFALIPAMALALGQAYVGLSLPPWANAAALVLSAAAAFKRPVPKKALAALACAACAVLLAVALLFPGVDAATEEASERARDALSRLSGSFSQEVSELPREMAATRHVNTRSLLSGEGASRQSDGFRLVTQEEKQISIPRWIDYARIALLLLASVAVLVLPFVPFAVLNARRKRERAARSVFDGEDVGAGICAMFRRV